MPQVPEIALLVSTFERPQHLRRVLRSISLQKHVDGKFEVVVTDDGSADETASLVSDFARTAPFPVHFTTHAHDGFRLAQCRNEGVMKTAAPYLVFLDGDCLIPPDYVYQHFRSRRRRTAMSGDCCRLDRVTSERIDEAAIRSAAYIQWAPAAELQRLAREKRKAWWYYLTRSRSRPKLLAGTAAMWREDYERINGYDENFHGWGCEDDDLRWRLSRSGVRIKSVLWRTFSYHLWHPPVASCPKIWREGQNVRYLTRGLRLTRCRNGLKKLSPAELVVRMVGTPDRPDLVAKALKGRKLSNVARPEVEILALPGKGLFTGRAECNILLLLDDGIVAPAQLLDQAHVVLAPRHKEGPIARKWHGLDDFENVLRAVA
jgi:glycosyltransferase involved in cell wall biosynthesis